MRLRLEIALTMWTSHKYLGVLWTFIIAVVHHWYIKFKCLFLLLEYGNDNWINFSDFQRHNFPPTFNIHFLYLAQNKHSLNVCWKNYRFPILSMVRNIHYNNVKTNIGLLNSWKILSPVFLENIRQSIYVV